MADAAYGSLPFKEQSEFFRRKLNLPLPMPGRRKEVASDQS